MKIRNYIYIFFACYLATFLRIFINNNLIVSIIGSFFFGFFIAKRLSYSKEKIIFTGFFLALHPSADLYFFCTKFLIKGIGLNL